MAGLDANKVYLPTPDQSSTTGAISVAPVDTPLPKTAREKLDASTWESGGYVGDAGIAHFHEQGNNRHQGLVAGNRAEGAV